MPDQTPAQGLRILLAEDDSVNQKLMAAVLESYGHAVTLAENGIEALRLIDGHPFDLILMDVQMPELDGLEATRAIRHKEKHKDTRTRIVAITARAMNGDREMCLAAGMDAYLPKPIHLAELVAMLEAWSPREGHLTADSAVVDQEPVLDLKAFEARALGNRALMAEIASLFVGQAETTMAQIRQAYKSNDTTLLARKSHLLKGSAGQLGGVRAARAAIKMEESARAREHRGIRDSLRILEREMAVLCDELGRFLTD